MRRSATCSDARGRARVTVVAVIMAVLVVTAAAGPVPAKVFMTQEEALKAAFPGGTAPKRETAYLTEEQATEVEKLSGEKLSSRVVTYYAAPAGTAWFDSHVVRTLPETIMIVVEPDGSILRIDILSFNEPEEYLPRSRWSEQLKGRRLDDDLSLRRGVRPMTGATLSSRAIVSASRRVLALHHVIVAAPKPEAGKP